MANLTPQQITLLRSQLQTQITTKDEHDKEDATNLLDYALDMLVENDDSVDIIVQEVGSYIFFSICCVCVEIGREVMRGLLQLATDRFVSCMFGH